jgi:hypothetical protein
MVLIRVFPALTGAALLMLGGASVAADYRADEFLSLDLSKAVLSPKRLGPPAEFAPVPLEAKGDVAKNDAKGDASKSDAAKSDVAKSDSAKSDSAKSDVAKGDTAKPGTPRSDVATSEPAPTRSERRAAPHRGPALAHVQAEKPRGAARTKLAHRHSNPLDAQARDTRIQTPRFQAHRIQSPRIQSPRIQTWPCNSGGICDWKQ